ncbi:hypothetical protein AAFF_G00415350 [Aldrovandia affinis]|uniref:Uncharacterized protein n=1 Tax=Aldrovandia affinis TaxID=143900 RepID=A0AAD7SD53_9TELE|nr:hypothetical protein AAFF_G00415350 [Aldrovandia affinis]
MPAGFVPAVPAGVRRLPISDLLELERPGPLRHTAARKRTIAHGHCCPRGPDPEPQPSAWLLDLLLDPAAPTRARSPSEPLHALTGDLHRKPPSALQINEGHSRTQGLTAEAEWGSVAPEAPSASVSSCQPPVPQGSPVHPAQSPVGAPASSQGASAAASFFIRPRFLLIDSSVPKQNLLVVDSEQLAIRLTVK